LLRRIRSTLAQINGPARSTTRYRHPAQFPFLWPHLHASRRRGSDLPAGFAVFAAYGDFATGVLAILALLTVGIRPLFWLFVAAFNLVGASDIMVDYYHGIQVGLPALAGELGAAYAIPIIYVPVLTITHFVAFYLQARPQLKAAHAVAVDATGY
jgi:hypothetical protein